MTEAEFNQAQQSRNVDVISKPVSESGGIPPMSPDEYQAVLESLRRPRIILSATPTFVPKTFAESIQPFDDGVTQGLYVYMNGTWILLAAPAAPPTLFDKFMDIVHWNSIDGFTLGGSAAVAHEWDGALIIASNTTINSDTYVYSKTQYVKICETGKLLTVEWQIANITNISDFIIRLYLTTSAAAPPVDTANHFGFQINHGATSKLYGCTGDGSTQTKVDLNTLLSSGTQRTRLKAVCNRGTDVKFYVNDVLVGTSTTNLPAASDLGFNLGIQTLVGAQKDFSLNRILLTKDY